MAHDMVSLGFLSLDIISLMSYTLNNLPYSVKHFFLKFSDNARVYLPPPNLPLINIYDNEPI